MSKIIKLDFLIDGWAFLFGINEKIIRLVFYKCKNAVES
jgi:hypothetical protein